MRPRAGASDPLRELATLIDKITRVYASNEFRAEKPASDESQGESPAALIEAAAISGMV